MLHDAGAASLSEGAVLSVELSSTTIRSPHQATDCRQRAMLSASFRASTTTVKGNGHSWRGAGPAQHAIAQILRRIAGTIVQGATSRVTTARAPATAPTPIVTPGATYTPAHTQA